MDREERHKIFKEELYPHASLPKLEFEVKRSEFLDNHPEIAKEEKIRVDFTKNQLRTFIRDWK